jgi:hypothetical protein
LACSNGEDGTTIHKAGDRATARKIGRGMVRKEHIMVGERVIVVVGLNKNFVNKHGSLTLLLF